MGSFGQGRRTVDQVPSVLQLGPRRYERYVNQGFGFHKLCNPVELPEAVPFPFSGIPPSELAEPSEVNRDLVLECSNLLTTIPGRSPRILAARDTTRVFTGKSRIFPSELPPHLAAIDNAQNRMTLPQLNIRPRYVSGEKVTAFAQVHAVQF
jgi:hypothetical protein